MGTFIILAITISMIFTYVNSIKMSKFRAIKTQSEIIENLKKADEENGDNMVVTGTQVAGFFLSLYYLTFYVISAVMIDTFWATIVAGLASVFSVKSYFTALDFLKARKIRPISYWGKIPTVLMLAYTIYFFVIYVNSRFTHSEMLYLGLGLIVGAVLILILRVVKNRKRKTN